MNIFRSKSLIPLSPHQIININTESTRTIMCGWKKICYPGNHRGSDSIDDWSIGWYLGRLRVYGLTLAYLQCCSSSRFIWTRSPKRKAIRSKVIKVTPMNTTTIWIDWVETPIMKYMGFNWKASTKKSGTDTVLTPTIDRNSNPGTIKSMDRVFVTYASGCGRKSPLFISRNRFFNRKDHFL